MIRLPAVALPSDTQATLERLQDAVNAHPTYSQQVEAGQKEYTKARQRKEFDPVMGALTEMCSGARRCHYCEDSAATDVEHIHPKEYYPHLVFAWENYLYACPRCNRPKSTRFDIYSHVEGSRISVPAHVKEKVAPPPNGDALLINPRTEAPMTFLLLDIRDTFLLYPTAKKETREWERARYTIEVLKLNENDVLPEARKEAYHSYIARLKEYIQDQKHGNTTAHLVNALKRMQHPTVWHEMKRQQSRIPSLRELFSDAPAALGW